MKEISNRRLTLLRKLSQKKYRYKEQRFFVEGARAVQQVIENKKLPVDALFFDESQSYWEQSPWSEYVRQFDASLVASDDFLEVTDTDHPQGVMALCVMPNEAEPENLAKEAGIIIAFDAVQDPGNVGTIIRTAAWFGAAGLLAGKGTVDLFHPKVVRSTAGATGILPCLNGDLTELLPVFEEQGWQVVLLDAGDDSVPLSSIERQEKTILVVGNEANGIDQSRFDSQRVKARIVSPQKDHQVESLNAAIATSIALHALTVS